MEKQSVGTELPKKQRYGFLDSFRGIVLISMIIFHACWDLVYLFQMKWDWYFSDLAYIWQQSICWSFILLSGFCWPLGKHPVKRGVIVSLSGILISVATTLFVPEGQVIFGVLTLIGVCMLLMTLLDKVCRRVPPIAGMLTTFFLFVISRDLRLGYLGFENGFRLNLPEALYRGKAASLLGFMEKGFYSADYFPIFPWMFLFITGYFLCRWMKEKKTDFMEHYLKKEWKGFSFLGRNSLWIYLLHQPVVYGVLWMMDLGGVI